MESSNYKKNQRDEKKAVSKIATLNRKKTNNAMANIPNALTIARIIMVPLVVILMLVQFDIGNASVGQIQYLYRFTISSNIIVTVHFNMLLAAIFFIIACFTDLIDGIIARKYDCVTEFGKIWDPIADKALINSVLIVMATGPLNANNGAFLPPWIPILFILRDIMVNASRMSAAKQNIDVSANVWGKIKTVLEMIGIIVIFFVGAPYVIEGNMSPVCSAYYWYGIQEIVLYFALIASFWSAIRYMVDMKYQIVNRDQRY